VTSYVPLYDARDLTIFSGSPASQTIPKAQLSTAGSAITFLMYTASLPGYHQTECAVGARAYDNRRRASQHHIYIYCSFRRLAGNYSELVDHIGL